MTHHVRVLIADDHEVVREGTRMLIAREPGWQVCGTAKSGREAVEQVERLRPDVAVIDMGMPDLDGLEAARRIKKSSPETEVLIFTARESEELIRAVFEAGAKSYILKSEAATYLIDAVRAVSQHKPFFTTTVSKALFDRLCSRQPHERAQNRTDRLTPRERQIACLLAEGHSNKEVADIVRVSLRTVETHRAAIFKKPEIGSLAGLIRYVIRNGLIDQQGARPRRST